VKFQKKNRPSTCRKKNRTTISWKPNDLYSPTKTRNSDRFLR